MWEKEEKECDNDDQRQHDNKHTIACKQQHKKKSDKNLSIVLSLKYHYLRFFYGYLKHSCKKEIVRLFNRKEHWLWTKKWLKYRKNT